ncbi:hypothetical protein T8T21_00290 [Limimaricola variabilis]|nr:hypothetical protein [Limimaricola variabilis]WPY94598.1 hypothetical protein T8T21_00290 [Limimaricola variabilis]
MTPLGGRGGEGASQSQSYRGDENEDIGGQSATPAPAVTQSQDIDDEIPF